MRLCEIPLALAAAHQSGHPDCCFHPRFGQMGPQGREIVTPSPQFIGLPRSRKMNFKKLTIAAAIVAMTSLSAVAPVYAQAAAPAAPAADAAPPAAAPAAPAADAAAPAAPAADKPAAAV